MVTLVLLPGMDGTGILFAPFVAALGSEFAVKIVRYPNTEPLGYAELTEFARAALPAEGEFFILGESFSGPIAIFLAASCSPRLKGLILCCSFARNPRPAFSGLRALVNALPIAMMPTWVLSHMLLGSFTTAAWRSTLAQVTAQVSPSALRERLASVLSVNASAELAALNMPVLYLRASHDRVVPARASQLVSRLNPQTKVVQVVAPHFLLQAAPKEAAQVVGTFIHEVQNAVDETQYNENVNAKGGR